MNEEYKNFLTAEWIKHLNMYRLYSDEYPAQTVAYVDSVEEAIIEHPEYIYVVKNEVNGM